MTTIQLHPEFLTKDGRREFAVLRYEEFVELEEWLHDISDLLEIRDARNEVSDEPNVPLEEIEKVIAAKQ
jgi:hypothetical protein